MPSDKIPPAIDSTAKGESVARRRFQRGRVRKNKAGTVWFGRYAEYVLDHNGTEQRRRKQITLGPVRKPDGNEMTKREALRLLQPHVDRANASIANPTTALKSVSFESFTEIWIRDYLSLSKRSTQATMRGHAKRLKAAFGQKVIRQIDAGDLQRVVAVMEKEGYEPKTIRNLWVTARLIWNAACIQGYVDSIIPKPKLPRSFRTKPRYYTREEVAKIIANSEGAERVFYWVAAETGMRAGELCALQLSDISTDRITINQSVWNGQIGVPKTPNAIREIAVSSQLSNMIAALAEQQRSKQHTFLFSSSTGRCWDVNLFRGRKMQPLLSSLGIEKAGLHAFRHFNASLLSTLRTPLKTIQERLGHASTGSLTLDVYMHSEWKENEEAAQLAGDAIEKAVNSVN